MLGKCRLEISRRRSIEGGDVPKKRERPLDAYPERKPVEGPIFKKVTSTHQNNREEAELDRRIREIAKKAKEKLASIEEFYRHNKTNNPNKVE